MNHRPFAAALTCGAILSLLSACAAAPAGAPGSEPEPVVHEYRTGSLLAQREKRATTEEERQAARDAAAAMMQGPVMGDPSKAR